MALLTARAFAEMLNLPAYEQERILYEQKYPNQQPQSFKIPYYQPALKGIRSYYKSGNDRVELAAARAEARSLSLAFRAQHNLRVINSFARSSEARRQLLIESQSTVVIQAAADVEIKLRFDIAALEANNPKRLLYNFRSVAIDEEIAKTSLEVAFWVLDKNGTPIPLRALEYVDLESGDTYRITRTRARTTKLIAANARIISTLWPVI